MKIKNIPSRQYGFSLLELTLIIFLIGLIAGALTLRFNHKSAMSNVAYQAELLLNDIRYVQSYAMQQNKKVSLEFKADHYMINTSPKQRVNLQTGILLQSTLQVLTFDALGRPQHTGEIVLSDYEQQQKIIISAETGYANLQV